MQEMHQLNQGDFDVSLDAYGRTASEAIVARMSQAHRATMLWEALGRPMGADGLRLLEEATASMSTSEFKHAIEQVER